MSKEIDSDSKEPIIFYLDETKDDFTFYLDAENNRDVFEKLIRLSGTDQKDKKAKKALSVSEEISFTNLVLRTGSVEKIAERFWIRLASGDPPCDYLLEKMKVLGPDAAKMVSKVKSKTTLSPEHQKEFSKLLNEILTNQGLEDLLEQEWIDSKPFTKTDYPILLALKENKDQLGGYKRFLIAAFFPEFSWKTDRGRALICFSHSKRYLSVTVRKLKQDTGYLAKFHEKEEDRKKFLFSPGEYCHTLYEQVFQETDSMQHAQGLLVVTGSTNSLKSEIARGLIDLYLTKKTRSAKDRAHHLVTFEDPIEKFYYAEANRGPARVALTFSKEPRKIDYTPRQKHRDAPALRAALNDALRQTPAVFFVGETRNKKEWEVLLDFAATGHLIVTTAHAGSLVEAMHKIFEACNVQTSGDRAEITSKLLGLIHLRASRVVHGYDNLDRKLKEKTTGVLIPAIWRRTGGGVAALTSNGLASLLPERPPKREGSATSCLGRRWFIDELVRHANDDLNNVFGNHLTSPFKPEHGVENEKTGGMISQLHRQAREWDLQGV